MSGAAAGDDRAAGDQAPPGALDPRLVASMRARWDELQVGFVDRPRAAVEDADRLVGEVLDELGRVFRDHRAELEARSGGDAGSTEDLRVALFRYREFLERLLSF